MKTTKVYIDGQAGTTGLKLFDRIKDRDDIELLMIDQIRSLPTCLPYEVDREREFAPIKNKTGRDSVESARRLCLLNGIEL
jgi:N-acetyl-gamma-glutamylphosphate reductase